MSLTKALIHQLERLNNNLDALQQEWKQRHGKLKKFRNALAIEANVVNKFQLEQQVQDEETHLNELNQKIQQAEAEIQQVNQDLVIAQTQEPGSALRSLPSVPAAPNTFSPQTDSNLDAFADDNTRESRESRSEFQYQIALSFAGEDRRFAERLAELLKNKNINVFYDGYEKAELWGKDLYHHLQLVYRDKAQFCVIFLSKSYARKLWTRHELEQAQARAFRENKEYILPIRIDDTNIPGINETIAYLELGSTSLEQIADLLEGKISSSNADSIKNENASLSSAFFRKTLLYKKTYLFISATVVILILGSLTATQWNFPSINRNPTTDSDSPPNSSLAYSISDHPDLFNTVVFSPDSQTIFSGSYDLPIKSWNSRSGELLDTLSEASSNVWSIAISPNGRLLASAHRQNGTIKLWDVKSRKLLHTLFKHSGDVRSVAFSPNGQTLASGGDDKTIKLWRVGTGELLYTFPKHINKVTSVAFSPDGKTLASASDDKSIKLWSLDTKKLVHHLRGHLAEVSSVAFSPDSQLLASGSWDKTIKLWNLRTGKLQNNLTGHDEPVWCLAISPDGQLLASGSYDKSIKLWNLQTGKHLRTFTGHTKRVLSAAFSPNGQLLASGSEDESIRMWRVFP